MPRLSAMHGNVGLILVVAVGTWWLAGAALEIGGGRDDVAELGARAAVLLVTAQWLAIALFAPHVDIPAPTSYRSAALSLMSITAPLWPLLAVLWLSSRLSLAAVIGSQLGALALAACLVWATGLAAPARTGTELGQPFRVAIGPAAAGILWTARAPLAGWMLP